jgi:hypothetical protein
MLLEHNYRYHFRWVIIGDRRQEVPELDGVTLKPKTIRGPWPELAHHRKPGLKRPRPLDVIKRASPILDTPRRRQKVRGPVGRSRQYIDARLKWAHLDGY